METWEELFSRDPLSLGEDDVLAITAKLVSLCRKEIEIWNQAKAAATANGTRLSGTAIKKKQAELAFGADKISLESLFAKGK